MTATLNPRAKTMQYLPMRLASARESVRISRNAMADLLNVSRNTIYRLEQYTGLPPKIDLCYVQQYSEITGKSLCWLLLGIDIQATAEMTEARLLELEDVLTRSIQTTFQSLKTESFSALKK